jgi:hypothetical protein
LTFLASSGLTTSIHCPCYCTVYIYIRLCDSIWFEYKWICAGFLLFVYVHISVGNKIIKTRTGGLKSNWPVSQRYIYMSVHTQDMDFSRHMSWSFICSVISFEKWLFVFILISMELWNIVFHNIDLDLRTPYISWLHCIVGILKEGYGYGV